MSATGEMIAAEAREWIGTRFAWQHSAKGVLCDCKGLIAGVARECNRPEGESLHALASDYGDIVPVPRLIAGLRELFDRQSDAAIGDVLLLEVRSSPQHLGICTSVGPLRAVQALHTRPHKVVEIGVPAASVHSIWRWRDS